MITDASYGIAPASLTQDCYIHVLDSRIVILSFTERLLVI